MTRKQLIATATAWLSLSSCTEIDRARYNQLISLELQRQSIEPLALAQDSFYLRALRAEISLSRADFLPRRVRAAAGLDLPLPIGAAQPISDPHVVAVMTAVARIAYGTRVLEIGTGSGYQAAVLSRLGARVSTVEIIPELARRAARTLRRQGMADVATRLGDGGLGWPERAPFDVIIVTAGTARIPPALLAQLAPGGRLIIPLGPTAAEERIEVWRHDPAGTWQRCSLGPATFVPLTGEHDTRRTAQDQQVDGMPFCFGQAVT